jgi:hypothetical protein
MVFFMEKSALQRLESGVQTSGPAFDAQTIRQEIKG